MKNIIISIIILMLHACSKQDFTSCDGTEEDVLIKSGKFYGDVKLNDSNNHWLMYDYRGNLVSFINDKGFQLDYLQSGYFYDDTQTIRTYTKGEKELCVNRIDYEDFCWAKGEKMEYEPKGDGNIYTFDRYLTLKWDSVTSDSFVLTNKFEGLYFSDTKPNYWGGNYFYINKDTLFNSTSQKFYLSKILRNKEFKNVFELINIKADTTVVETKGYYFSYEQGLIGYYLTNNELWLKK
jgi:hypothetical protein